MIPGVVPGWCEEREPREWKRLWEAYYDTVDVAQQYWLAYRSYPEALAGGETSPVAWGYNPTTDWELLVEALDLACNSAERRYLMNDAAWANELIFPLRRVDGEVVVTRDSDRLSWMLAYGVGDHGFRGEMMWNLAKDYLVRPAEVKPCPGDMEEFIRRVPSEDEWVEACTQVDSGEGILSPYEALPTALQCAVGALRYRDDWYGGSTWSVAIARYRRKDHRHGHRARSI